MNKSKCEVQIRRICGSMTEVIAELLEDRIECMKCECLAAAIRKKYAGIGAEQAGRKLTQSFAKLAGRETMQKVDTVRIWILTNNSGIQYTFSEG